MISRVYFPLGTGLEPVSGARDLTSVERAKQASILFDQVVVEGGMRAIDLGPEMIAYDSRQGPESLTHARVAQSRTLEPGCCFRVSVRRDGDTIEIAIGTGVHPTGAETAVEIKIVERYVAEHHTAFLDDLAALNASWVRVLHVAYGPDGRDVNDTPLARLAKGDLHEPSVASVRLTPAETKEFVQDLTRVMSQKHRPSSGEAQETFQATSDLDGTLAAAFAEAAEIAGSMQAAFAVAPSLAPLARDRGVPLSLPGAGALSILVPNVSGLPWEAVAEFREHPGAQEARERLRGLESHMLADDPESPEAILATAQAVTSALVGATEDFAPKLSEDLRGPLVETGVGFIPFIGQYASLALSIGDMVSIARQAGQYKGSWLAAVFELRREAIAQAIDR